MPWKKGMTENMEKEFKSGFVTIIGRTNVGKSTLINLLVGEKVAAIANKVQTTRTAIRGIVNTESEISNLLSFKKRQAYA